MNNEPAQPQALLTVAEVAKWLSISSSLVYQLVDSGRLPVVRIGNGRGAIRFQPGDIADYIESCRSQAEPIKTPIIRPRLKHLKLK